MKTEVFTLSYMENIYPTCWVFTSIDEMYSFIFGMPADFYLENNIKIATRTMLRDSFKGQVLLNGYINGSSSMNGFIQFKRHAI